MLHDASVLTQEQVNELVLRLLESARDGCTESEIVRMLEFAITATVDWTLLEMFRSGRVTMRFPDDDTGYIATAREHNQKGE